MKQNRYTIVLAFLLVLTFFFKYIFSYFAPFLIGILIATVIHPLIDFLEFKGCPRNYSSLVFVIISFGGLLVIAGSAVIGLLNETEQLILVLEQIYLGADQWLEQMTLFFHKLSSPLLGLIPVFHQSLNQILLDFLNNLVDFLGYIPSLLIFWFLAAMTTFFISRDKNLIMNFLTGILPNSWQRILFGFKREAIHGLLAYLKAQIILMCVSASATVIGLLIVGQPYSWVLGFVVGIFEFLPFVGPSAILLPLVIYNLIMGRMGPAIGAGCIYLLTTLVRQAWEPQLIGGRLGLHPLGVLVSVYFGIRLLGVGGFFFGPLLMIFTKAFYLVVFDQI